MVKWLIERRFSGGIIVYSGTIDLNLVADFQQMGVDAVVPKESSRDELLGWAKRVLTKS